MCAFCLNLGDIGRCDGPGLEGGSGSGGRERRSRFATHKGGRSCGGCIWVGRLLGQRLFMRHYNVSCQEGHDFAMERRSWRWPGEGSRAGKKKKSRSGYTITMASSTIARGREPRTKQAWRLASRWYKTLKKYLCCCARCERRIWTTFWTYLNRSPLPPRSSKHDGQILCGALVAPGTFSNAWESR
jgi:hypothetical protein